MPVNHKIKTLSYQPLPLFFLCASAPLRVELEDFYKWDQEQLNNFSPHIYPNQKKANKLDSNHAYNLLK
jgi:hypothetical protein